MIGSLIENAHIKLASEQGNPKGAEKRTYYSLVPPLLSVSFSGDQCSSEKRLDDLGLPLISTTWPKNLLLTARDTPFAPA